MRDNVSDTKREQSVSSKSQQQRAKLTSWEKDGEEKHGLSVVADKVMTAYAAGKARKAARDSEEVTA